MTIMAVDGDPKALANLERNLRIAFPQELIVTFRGPLAAIQYTNDHLREIALVFSTVLLPCLDGLEFAKCLHRASPSISIFFTVQSASHELIAILKQHGDGRCLLKPVTVEAIREVTSFLDDPYPCEDDGCEEGGICD